MTPKVCIGVPEVNGQCLDEVIYDIAISLYNMDYETWEKGFIRHGGDRDLSRHIWDKWKVVHADDFFGAYGNVSSAHRRRIIATVLDDVNERNYRDKWEWEEK